jgi:predicted short-subunit dehydrogenase-like oxidoreductase (DUF2520 family)
VTDAPPRSSAPPVLRVVGPGRAGSSLARALVRAGWQAAPAMGHHDDPSAAAEGVDLVLIATPDAVVAEVAAAIAPRSAAVVAHVSGSLGLAAFASSGHARVGVLHPLVALPDPEVGARRLVGAWFAVAGDPLVERVVDDLGGRPVRVAEDQWTSYHAAAVIASNHVVAVLGQAERVAARAGIDFAVYLDLVRATLDNVAELGPAAALTGPAARGDEATVARHLAALDPDERPGYRAGAALARRLAGRPDPVEPPSARPAGPTRPRDPNDADRRS